MWCSRRPWLSQLDTRTPPVIISPSSGPDKDLDIADGVESVECSQSSSGSVLVGLTRP